MTPGKSTSSGYPVPVTEELLRQITQRIVEQFTPEKDFFIHKILREGRVLYER